jgi:hypothetical protein
MMNEEEPGRKRKAPVDESERMSDSVATPTSAGTGMGLVPVMSTLTPLDSFLATFPAQPAGTLEAWKKYMDKAKVIMEFVVKAVKEVDCDAVSNMLTDKFLTEQFGGLGLDFKDLKEALKDGDLSQSRPKMWLRVIHFCLFVSCTPIGAVYEKLKEIRETLKTFSTLSNKTEVGTQTAQREIVNAVSDEEYAKMMEGVHVESPSKPLQDLQAFIQTPQSILPWWPLRKPVEDVAKFSDFWNSLIIDSAKVDAEGWKNKKNKLSDILQAVLNWNDHQDTGCYPAKKKIYPFPNAIAAEKEAVQPLLGTFLRALLQICDDSEGCSDLRRERYMPKTSAGTRRFIDFESQCLDPFTPLLLGQELSFIKEVKNVRRKNESAESLHAEVTKQICGHLGKRALVAFEIGDVGVDSTSVGLVMTPVYMQVIRLKLENMGTEQAKVQFERTNLMPLVNRDAFEALVENQTDRNYLEPLLFPQEGPPLDGPIPTGMLHLWQLLHSSDEHLDVSFFGRKNQVANFIGCDDPRIHSIGKLLGSGSQGIVYAVEEDKDIVVKASVVGEVRYIRRELKALEKLGKAEMCKHICELRDMGRVQYTIRNTTTVVPAFVMFPKGLPARDHLHLSSEGSRPKKVEMLLLLWSNMLAALDFAHEKKVFHLDVSPRNIIYHNGSFTLIDWGCAACDGEQVTGFRGSLPFAHADVHGRGNAASWSPEKKHDAASLLFTICALNVANSVPWADFNGRLKPGTNAFDVRRALTKTTLRELIREYKNTSADPADKRELYGVKVRDRAEKIDTKIADYVDDA